MSALGRLWARAPLWRRAVLVTCASGVMTALYPPAWLGGAAPTSPVSRNGATLNPAAPPVAAPAISRQEPAPVVQLAGKNIPVAGEFYSGYLRLGAQSVPLPPGRWLAFAVSDANASGGQPGGVPGVEAFLGLVLGGRIVAAAVIGGSIAPDPREAGFPAPLEAQNPSFYYRRVLSAADHGALDFWVCGLTMPARWNDALRRAAIGVARQQALSLPDRLDSAVFRFADKRNWLIAEVMFADPAGEAGAIRPWTDEAALPDAAVLPYIEKVRRWGKAWHEVLRRGFTGVQRPGEEARIALP